jgi:hypothetical protein
MPIPGSDRSCEIDLHLRFPRGILNKKPGKSEAPEEDIIKIKEETRKQV